MKKAKCLVIGNWKMNPRDVSSAKKLLLDINKHLSRKKLLVEIMVAPPAVFLSQLGKFASGKISLVGQAMHPDPVGAHTGDISAPMLQSVGVETIIVGHSERRAGGVTDTQVNQVVQTALKAKMMPIICVGEKERDSAGDFYEVVESQIRVALAGVPASKLSQIVIAYEPIWAIGTGNTATPEDALEMKLYIQKVLINLYNRKASQQVSIIYGGSVKKKNAQELLERGEVDGFLIGGASLKADEFCSIIDYANNYVKSTTK